MLQRHVFAIPIFKPIAIVVNCLVPFLFAQRKRTPDSIGAGNEKTDKYFNI